MTTVTKEPPEGGGPQQKNFDNVVTPAVTEEENPVRVPEEQVNNENDRSSEKKEDGQEPATQKKVSPAENNGHTDTQETASAQVGSNTQKDVSVRVSSPTQKKVSTQVDVTARENSSTQVGHTPRVYNVWFNKRNGNTSLVFTKWCTWFVGNGNNSSFLKNWAEKPERATEVKMGFLVKHMAWFSYRDSLPRWKGSRPLSEQEKRCWMCCNSEYTCRQRANVASLGKVKKLPTNLRYSGLIINQGHFRGRESQEDLTIHTRQLQRRVTLYALTLFDPLIPYTRTIGGRQLAITSIKFDKVGLLRGDELVLKPDTRPISHESLVAKVEGIYAGLFMVEAKCITVDKNAAKPVSPPKPEEETTKLWTLIEVFLEVTSIIASLRILSAIEGFASLKWKTSKTSNPSARRRRVQFDVQSESKTNNNKSTETQESNAQPQKSKEVVQKERRQELLVTINLQQNIDPCQALRQYNTDECQALIALHQVYQDEQHDFIQATQHPPANAAVKRLALKYSMPARLCKHGIYAFLEVMRCRLPAMIDPMLTFIYMSYNMMSLLYETVEAFETTWIECLGDISRHRMAIGDNDKSVRERWKEVAWEWYSMASDHTPWEGRLYHHIAILAGPNTFLQMFYYTKALTVPKQFWDTRHSIFRIIDHFVPSATRQEQACEKRLPMSQDELNIMKACALLFLVSQPNDFLQDHNYEDPEKYLSDLDLALEAVAGTLKVKPTLEVEDIDSTGALDTISETTTIAATDVKSEIVRKADTNVETARETDTKSETASGADIEADAVSEATMKVTNKPETDDSGKKGEKAETATDVDVVKVVVQPPYIVQPGYELAILLCSILVGYPSGELPGPVWDTFFPGRLMAKQNKNDDTSKCVPNATKETNDTKTCKGARVGIPWIAFDKARELLSTVCRRILGHPDLSDVCLYWFLHCMLVFIVQSGYELAILLCSVLVGYPSRELPGPVWDTFLAILLCSVLVGYLSGELLAPVWDTFFPGRLMTKQNKNNDTSKDAPDATKEKKDTNTCKDASSAAKAEDIKDCSTAKETEDANTFKDVSSETNETNDTKTCKGARVGIPWIAFDKARELLSTVCRRILERPDLSDVGLYRFLHCMLVFMRYVAAHPHLRDIFDNEFHVELMAPILNLLLQKYKARGGNSWDRILSNQFPVEYVRANVPPECLIYGPGVGVPMYSRPLPEDIFGIRGCAWAPEATPPVKPKETPDEVARKETATQEPKPKASESNEASQETAAPQESNESEPKHASTQEAESKEVTTQEAAVTQETEQNYHAPQKTRPKEATKQETAVTQKTAPGTADTEAKTAKDEEKKVNNDKPDFTYYPANWFLDTQKDFPEKFFEDGTFESIETIEHREVRLLWLVNNLAKYGAFFVLNIDRGHCQLLARYKKDAPELNFEGYLPSKGVQVGSIRTRHKNPFEAKDKYPTSAHELNLARHKAEKDRQSKDKKELSKVDESNVPKFHEKEPSKVDKETAPKTEDGEEIKLEDSENEADGDESTEGGPTPPSSDAGSKAPREERVETSGDVTVDAPTKDADTVQISAAAKEAPEQATHGAEPQQPTEVTKEMPNAKRSSDGNVYNALPPIAFMENPDWDVVSASEFDEDGKTPVKPTPAERKSQGGYMLSRYFS